MGVVVAGIALLGRKFGKKLVYPSLRSARCVEKLMVLMGTARRVYDLLHTLRRTTPGGTTHM